MKNGQTVDDNLVALIAKIGEKITIGKAKTSCTELRTFPRGILGVQNPISRSIMTRDDLQT